MRRSTVKILFRLFLTLVAVAATLLYAWRQYPTPPRRYPQPTYACDIGGRKGTLNYIQNFFDNLVRVDCECCPKSLQELLVDVNALYDSFDRTADGQYIYPDFFAGIYVRRSVDGGFRTRSFYVDTKLEEAQAHEAFWDFATKWGFYRPVRFSLNQLIETRDAVLAAIEARPDNCLYAFNVNGPVWISTSDNRVHLALWMRDGQTVEGFARYIYDSPMLEIQRTFFLPMGYTRMQNRIRVASGVWALITLIYVVFAPLILITQKAKTKPLNYK